MANVLTHRRVLAIALPIVISNATVPILGLVDTGVVGQLGTPEPIGAVGLGAMILTMIYWVFGFLRMGTTGMTSQAVGAGNQTEVSALLMRSLLLGGGFGIFLILCQVPIFWAAFTLSPATAEVEGLARTYIQIRVWSAPAAIAIYGITGWLIAQERTRAVLLLQVWMNGLNIALDVVFVLGLGMGVGGVAFATFIAEWSGLALGLWLCRAAFKIPGWRDPARVFDIVRLKAMALVNVDILLRSLVLQAIMVTFVFWSAEFGNVPLAANQILLQFLSVTAFALDGFAFSAETLVGQSLGARNRAALRRSSILATQWGVAGAALLSLGFWAFGPYAISIMTTSPEVREFANAFLPFMIAAPVAGVWAWMLDGIFIGATRTKDMRNMSFLTGVIYFATAPFLIDAFGNHGLWIALFLSYILRALTLAVRYPSLEAEAG